MEIAQYFASLDLLYPPPQKATAAAAVLSRGETLVKQGDRSRNIPACTQCHGDALTGLEISAEHKKNRPFFLNRIFGCSMKRSLGGRGERMKIDRRMSDFAGTKRFIKILLEIASARIENAEPEVGCVSGRHSIGRLIRSELEWSL